MAIFKAPRITTAQRLPLLLQASEIVYDVDTKSFWGGNGITLGGFPLGAGFAEGETQIVTLTQEDIDNASVTLERLPLSPSFLTVEVIGGIIQLPGIDYETIGQELSWAELGLDDFLEVGDILIINFLPFTGGLTGGGAEIITLTQDDINNKYVQLAGTATQPEDVRLSIINGITQLYGVDYVIGGNVLSWSAKGLDGFLEVNDILYVQF